jgi:hypothetical protein
MRGKSRKSPFFRSLLRIHPGLLRMKRAIRTMAGALAIIPKSKRLKIRAGDSLLLL